MWDQFQLEVACIDLSMKVLIFNHMHLKANSIFDADANDNVDYRPTFKVALLSSTSVPSLILIAHLLSLQRSFFLFYAYIISHHYWQLDLEKIKEIKRKLLPELLISWTLTFNILAITSPIRIIFSAPESVD